jgi:hypothetical protein
MKKKSSIITRPPNMDGEQGSEGNLAVVVNKEQNKEALIKLIRKGAPSVPLPEKDEIENEDPRIKLTLRVRKSLIERVEGASKERPLKTPANTWITEAILEKLKKEGF